MLLQKIAGAGLIIGGYRLGALVSDGLSAMDSDGTGAFLLIILGIILLVSKRKVFSIDGRNV